MLGSYSKHHVRTLQALVNLFPVDAGNTEFSRRKIMESERSVSVAAFEEVDIAGNKALKYTALS